MLSRSRTIALGIAFVLLATVALGSTPAAAGTDFKDIPTGNLINVTVSYSNPNPLHQVLAINQWWYLTMSNGCQQKVKFGNFAGYAYAQMAYVQGNCNYFGGIGLSYVVNGQGSVTTNPFWSDSGAKRECVVSGSSSVWFCTQLSDGSIWNQPQQSAPNNFGTSVVGIHATVCWQQYSAWDGELDHCTTWWLTAF